MDRLIDFAAAEKPKQPICAGMIFRCQHGTFMTKAGYGEQTRMNLQKRLSCPGCERCGGFQEMLQEYAAEGDVGLENAEDGAYYTLRVSGGDGPDHNGEWDECYLDFVKWERKQ